MRNRNAQEAAPRVAPVFLRPRARKALCSCTCNVGFSLTKSVETRGVFEMRVEVKRTGPGFFKKVSKVLTGRAGDARGFEALLDVLVERVALPVGAAANITPGAQTEPSRAEPSRHAWPGQLARPATVIDCNSARSSSRNDRTSVPRPASLGFLAAPRHCHAPLPCCAVRVHVGGCGSGSAPVRHGQDLPARHKHGLASQSHVHSIHQNEWRNIWIRWIRDVFCSQAPSTWVPGVPNKTRLESSRRS